MIDLSSAPDVEVEIPDLPQLVSVTLTCRIEGCENEGVAITMSLTSTTSLAYCGACGQRITEYVEAPAEEGA